MRVNRSAILIILGFLTVIFLGASYSLWFNDRLIPFEVGVGDSPTPLAEADTGIGGSQYQSVRLVIDETGIASVTAKQLRNAGLSVEELSSSSLNLTKYGQKVPFLIQSSDEEEALYFYAQANYSPRRPESVYILSQGKGLDMKQRDVEPEGQGGSPSGQHRFTWEENRFFVDYAEADDAWMGPLLMAPDNWTYLLDEILPGEGPAELTVRLFSNSDGPDSPDHHVEIQVNGQTVADHVWDGIKYETISAPIEPGLLVPDEVNSITVIVHDDTNITAETVYIDDLELTYEGLISADQEQISFASDADNILVSNANQGLMVFDITDRDAPVYLTNLRFDNGVAQFAGGGESKRQYIALDREQSVRPTLEPVPRRTKTLRDMERGADYIAIIADVPGFEEAMEPLLDFREQQGLRVEKIPVEQVFDEFGAGHRSPEAIRDFLAFAYQNWLPPAPRYVLLVGDATYDLMDQMPGKNRNNLPTAMVYTNSGGFLARDGWFCEFDEDIQRMAIGRLPAQNAIQLRVMVRKTISFEEGEGSDDATWKTRALVVADDEDEFDQATSNLADDLAEQGYRVYELHMNQSKNIQYTIRSLINQGVILINYLGYGSSGAWGDEAVFQNSDARALFNDTRLPILTAFTSFNGNFAEPQNDSLAEILLRDNDGGIVAAIAPSGRAPADQFIPLADAFYDLLLLEGGTTIGDALRQLVIENEAAESEFEDAPLTLNLLGDPALRFYAP